VDGWNGDRGLFANEASSINGALHESHVKRFGMRYTGHLRPSGKDNGYTRLNDPRIGGVWTVTCCDDARRHARVCNAGIDNCSSKSAKSELRDELFDESDVAMASTKGGLRKDEIN